MGQYSYLYNALRKTAALNKRAEYLEKLHNYFMMQKTAGLKAIKNKYHDQSKNTYK